SSVAKAASRPVSPASAIMPGRMRFTYASRVSTARMTSQAIRRAGSVLGIEPRPCLGAHTAGPVGRVHGLLAACLHRAESDVGRGRTDVHGMLLGADRAGRKGVFIRRAYGADRKS